MFFLLSSLRCALQFLQFTNVVCHPHSQYLLCQNVSNNHSTDSLSDIYRKIKAPLSGQKEHTAPIMTTQSSSPLPTTTPGQPFQDVPDSKIPGNSDSSNRNFSGLRNLCDETNWTPGLWIHCHSTCGSRKTSVCGGLNNARNRIQTCL
jgi:hypothetical protein